VREISQETEETEKTGDREFPREFPMLKVLHLGEPYALCVGPVLGLGR